MNSSTRSTLRFVVLAAGFSTRLGRPKTLARVHGISLIRNTIDLLAPLATSRIIVVVPPRAVRTRAELRGQRLTFVENSQRANGLSTSVRRGLAHARYGAAVLMLPVDLSRLKRRDLTRMIARWCGSRRRVIARRLGSRGVTPLILPRWLCAQALGISGDRGLREFVGHLPPVQLALMNVPTAAWDVDTPQDLELARRRFGPPGN
jgi:molybdenum cofactor cytidylyltransferase